MRLPDSGLHVDNPAFPLLRALISYGEGLTTAAGAATGLTLECSDLANEPSYRGQLIKILSGDAAGQVRKIVNDTSLTGTVVFDQPVTDRNGAVVTITASTLFDILSVGVDSEILYYGITTAAGDVDGSTAIDTGLAVPFTVDDQPIGCTFRVIDCPTTSLESQDREIYDYDFGTSELFFSTPFTSQVPINTIYLILRARPSSAGGPGPQPEPTTEETMWQLGWNDAFDVAEAFPILTEKWAGGYISAGAADGTADINTTTANKLYVDILSAVAAAAEYGVRALWPNITRKWLDLVDAGVVVVNPNVTYVWGGVSVSRGVAWDALNYIRIYKRQRSAVAPLEDIAVEYRLAGGAAVTTAILATTQDNLAFKIERVENVWRCYYSLSQIPRHHWRLALEIEDPANSMTDTTTTYLSVYNPEDAAGQQISANFNNFEHYEMLGNLADIIGLLKSKGGALAYIGYCPPGMGASTGTILCPNLSGFVNDCFNDDYQMIVMKNANAALTAPELEMRRITDYASATGTFIVEAFSQNVEASDIVLVIHNSVAKNISVFGIADALSTAANIRDAARTEADDWWNGQQILMLSGLARGQVRPIWDFDAANDDILVHPSFDAVPVAGDLYVILSQYSEIVPRLADDQSNRLTSHVIGRKDDTPTPRVSVVATPIATSMNYLKALVARGMAAIHGVCDADMGASATIIDCDDLIGFGDDYFNTGFQMIVLKNASAPGTSPEMEMRDITDYSSVDGVFTVEAFSANVEASDVILVVQNNLASQVSVYGIADALSTAATIRDAYRTEADNWWNGQQILMLSGPARGQLRPIVDFDATLDDIYVAPNFDAVPVAGDVYAILTKYSELVPRAIDDTTNFLTSHVVGRKDDTPAPIMAADKTQVAYLKALVARGMAILQGTCNAGMAPSTITIVSDDLIGYGDAYFANHFYLTIIKNASSAGATPENEARLITAYTSVSGTFTVDAFSANVEAGDVFLILHETQMATLAGGERLDGVIPADRDRFDVGDATADTLRWASDYISIGTTDGLASIAGGKLNLDITAADALPAEYGVRRLQTLKGRNWYHQADFDVAATNANVTYVWAGLSVSPGIAWDANNYIRICKRRRSAVAPLEDIAVEYRLAGGAAVTTSILATTQDTMAFKIERIGDIWRCYYSLAIGSNHHWWVLAQEIEDAADALTDTVSAYISVYNPKDAVPQLIFTLVDDWEYFINLAALENILTNISIKGGALAYLGYCNVGMAASQTVIACSNLAGFSDDAFNSGYQMVVLKNASALATAPEMERRDITNYVSATGTFTTATFSQNVEASDIVLVVHVSVASQVATYGIATGGAAGTIVDTMRTEAADYWNGMQVVMLSGNGIGQVRAIYDFDAAGDTIYVTPDLGGAVVAGDAYAILSHWTDLTGDDTAGNRRVSEVLGDKETAAVYDVGAATAAMGYIKGLVDANITATGIADAGAAGSITDAARAEAADWWNGQTLLMLTGAAALQKRPITDFAAGVISVAPDFDGIPGIGDVYVILAHYNMIVPRLADALADALTSDVVGRKTDTADYTAGATQSSIVRFLKGIMGSLIIAEGVFTTSSATAPIDSARTEASGWFNNRVIIPLTGACAFQPRAVLQYTYLLGTGGTFTVDEAFTAATGAVAYIILSISYPATRLREIQGGTESLETLDDELDAIPDIAEVRTIASPVTLTGAVQYIYLNAPSRPFFFAGGFISRASGAWATGETVIVTVDAKIDGANYQNTWTATYVAEPSPILVPVPEAPWEFWNNGGGVRVGIVQSVVGAGFHTWNHSFIDGVPST